MKRGRDLGPEVGERGVRWDGTPGEVVGCDGAEAVVRQLREGGRVAEAMEPDEVVVESAVSRNEPRRAIVPRGQQRRRRRDGRRNVARRRATAICQEVVVDSFQSPCICSLSVVREQAVVACRSRQREQTRRHEDTNRSIRSRTTTRCRGACDDPRLGRHCLLSGARIRLCDLTASSPASGTAEDVISDRNMRRDAET